MRSMYLQFTEFSIFDDRGEVERVVDSLIQNLDPGVQIEHLRKIDFSYIFTLSKGGKIREVGLNRTEIDASRGWRNGHVDDILEKKIRDAVADF
jgi:hypothetical protein